MGKSKSNTPVIPVPQSRAEAAEYLRRIGDHQRDLARIETDMNDAIAKAKSDAEKAAELPHAQVVLLTEGLKTWCEANRAALTGDRSKTADLGTGTVSWRIQPDSVTLRGVPDILARLKELRLKAFIRTKEEVNKEAILASTGKVRAKLAEIPGLTIGSIGEVFGVEPFEATLGDAPAVSGEAA